MPRSRTARRVAALLGGCSVLAACATDAAAPPRSPPPQPPRPPATPTARRLRPSGWRGTPTRASDFADSLPPDWTPTAPRSGTTKGARTPEAITVRDGVATITATADGTTGAMSWHPGQRGRWEACIRMHPGPDALHGVVILWPVAEDFPAGGEIDWVEVFHGDRQEVTVNIHHGPPDRSFGGEVERDATQWTAWAVEWTPEHITTYADGEEWYSTDRSELFPPRPMNMTMQLDWFPPEGGGPAASGSGMHMDSSPHQWALPESEPATLSLAPGDPATGQPRLYPDRKPRPLGGGPLTRGRRVTKRIWGRDPPPTTQL